MRLATSEVMNTVLPDRASPVTPNRMTGSKKVSDTVSDRFSTRRVMPSAIAEMTNACAFCFLNACFAPLCEDKHALPELPEETTGELGGIVPLLCARYATGMPRYALKVEYHGAPFAGWQRQADQPSVQGAIEAALAKLEPAEHTIAAAGRTDAGVHARAQVAHCDLDKDWDPFRLSEALNHHLKPAPVAIVACAEVGPEWHARFSAIERRYMFRLLMRRAPATHDAGLVWRVNHMLELEPMREAAKYLIGKHDFTTFRSSICQAASPVKTLDALEINQVDGPSGPEIQLRLRARSFLHNQVRSFVGTLERVGCGSWAPVQVKSALEACDRAVCGPVCPPQGLYLDGVGYPDDPFDQTPIDPTSRPR